jgi:cellular nucleic acid-binding protein
MVGGKIGHIARNCPMNEGSYGGAQGGFGGQQGGGYNDSGKTCYACGGFGIYTNYHIF